MLHPVRILFVILIVAACFTGCKKPLEHAVVPIENCAGFSIDSVGIIPIDTVHNGGQKYLDFIPVDKGIIALSEKGQVFYWAYASKKATRQKIKRREISAITSDAAQNLYVVDHKTTVYKYDSTGKESLLGTADSVIHLIRVNSKNDVFAITSYGIYSITDRVNYFPDSLLTDPFTIDNFWHEPSSASLDSADNLWIGFDYGEWGGNIISFNTRSRSFNPITVDTAIHHMNPIQSVFPGPTGMMYATSGVMHFGVAGGILAIDQNFYCSIMYDKFHMALYPEDSIKGEYIGPGAFDYSANQILYYSHLGFFYGKYENNTFCKGLFYTPTLTWTAGQRMAVGAPMNVLKIHAIDYTRFVFLTRENGIGYLNKDKLTFLK